MPKTLDVTFTVVTLGVCIDGRVAETEMYCCDMCSSLVPVPRAHFHAEWHVKLVNTLTAIPGLTRQ